MAVLSETIALNVASRRHRVKRRHDYTETVSWKATSSSKFIFVCRTTQLKQISLLPDVHWMERSSVLKGRQPSFHKCGGVTQVIVFSRRRLSSCCVLDHRLGGPFSLVNRCFEPGASTTWLGTGSLLTSRMLAKRQPSGGRPRFRLTTRCRRPCEKTKSVPLLFWPPAVSRSFDYRHPIARSPAAQSRLSLYGTGRGELGGHGNSGSVGPSAKRVVPSCRGAGAQTPRRLLWTPRFAEDGLASFLDFFFCCCCYLPLPWSFCRGSFVSVLFSRWTTPTLVLPSPVLRFRSA